MSPPILPGNSTSERQSGVKGQKAIQHPPTAVRAPVPAQSGVIKPLNHSAGAHNRMMPVQAMMLDGQQLPSLLHPNITRKNEITSSSITILTAEKVPLRVVSPSATFYIGDSVKLLPKCAKQKLKLFQSSIEPDEALQKLMAAIGTVQTVCGSTITVKFKGIEEKLTNCYAPSNLQKINKYFINQLIKIRSDAPIDVQKLKGSIGQVIGIDENDPADKVFIRFDDAEINQLLPTGVPLSSTWMEPFNTAYLAIHKELLELFSLEMALFYKAVAEGDLRTAKLLYNRHPGVDIEARNPEGMTAIHIAILKGHTNLIEWLVDEVKVDMEKPDMKSYCPIHNAVLGGNPKVLEMLLRKGANVNSQTDCGHTALHIVVSRKLSGFFVLLKDFNADANLQDSEGSTPLHFAFWNQNYQRSLEEMMLIFHFKWDLCNKKGYSGFHLAVMNNNKKAIEFVTSKESVIRELLMEAMPVNAGTVLHFTCTYKNYAMTKLLLDKSKDLITSDNLPFLEKLLEARDNSSMTALLIASQCQDYGIVELLVEAGADVNATDKHGSTAIILAASSPQQNDNIPCKIKSPTAYKVYQHALMKGPEATKVMMAALPILSLISNLVANGSSLERCNHAGKKGADFFIKSGSVEFITEMITRLASKIPVRYPFCGKKCMGRSYCDQQPVNQLSCPHKPGFKACHNCFLSYFSTMKCGCPEEDIVPIPSSGGAPLPLNLSSWIKEESQLIEEIDADLFQNGPVVAVRHSSGGKNECMGRSDCVQPSVYHLSCPHKSGFKACHNCFLSYFSTMKCGCREEDIVPIPSSVGAPLPLNLSSWIKEESQTLEEIEPDNYDGNLFLKGPIIAVKFNDKEDGTISRNPHVELKRKMDDGDEIEGESSSQTGKRSRL